MSMDKAREALVFCDSLAQMLRSNDMAHWADNEVAFIKAALHPAPVVDERITHVIKTLHFIKDECDHEEDHRILPNICQAIAILNTITKKG